MENVVFYPDIVTQNLTFGDPKGHYQWGKQYFNLALTAFPSDRLPRFLEGSAYITQGSAFCARRGVRVI